jgi:hypothetical protein
MHDYEVDAVTKNDELAPTSRVNPDILKGIGDSFTQPERDKESRR